MQVVDLPCSWAIPCRAWVGAVRAPPAGEEVSIGRTSSFRRSGRFVLRSEAGEGIGTVPFAVGPGPEPGNIISGRDGGEGPGEG